MALRRWVAVSGAALLVGLAAIGCASPDGGVAETGTAAATSALATSTQTTAPAVPEAQATSAQATSAEVPAAGTTLAALESLAVKGRAPKTGYDRAEFGPRWADVDHNGCDTRNDMLARDLNSVTFRPGTNDCVVHDGVLDDPYTATEIHFIRGQGTSEAVHIDHVVALADAWQKGAQQLDIATRTQFGNDPLNLLAVDGPANMQKGAGDAATWLPANRSFRCDYVARQIAVKARYDLWVTSAEKDAMARVLDTCPGHTLPDDQTAATRYQVDTTATQSPAPAVVEPVAVEPAAVAPAAASGSLPQTGTDPRFGSCKKAKEAGYGPYVAGVDPEYDWYRDGDGDGTTCE